MARSKATGKEQGNDVTFEADIRWNNKGSLHKGELRDLKGDLILANPPFNISEWGGVHLREGVRR